LSDLLHLSGLRLPDMRRQSELNDCHVTYMVKGKAIPLHVMEALGGRGGIAPNHSRPRH
jgi:hypothetical protein